MQQPSQSLWNAACQQQPSQLMHVANGGKQCFRPMHHNCRATADGGGGGGGHQQAPNHTTSSSSSRSRAVTAHRRHSNMLQHRSNRVQQFSGVSSNSHNNAVPMPRNTAASAVAMAAPAHARHGPYLPVQQQQQQQQYPMVGSGSSSSGVDGARPPLTAAAAAAAIRLSRQLTKDIMACSCVHELQQLYQQHKATVNLIHISALLKQLTRCVQQQQQQQQQGPQWKQLVQQLESHCVQLLSAVQLPHPAAVQVLRAAGPQLLQAPGELNPWLHQHHEQQQQQHYRNSSRARLPGRVNGSTVMPQQLCTICWSLARLGHDPSSTWWACYWAASTPLLQSYSPKELATAVAAAGDLRQVPPASWMSAFEAACVAGGGLSDASPQELCMMLRGVAVLRLQPGEQWVHALQAAVLDKLDSLGPRDLSQVLWGHASLALKPSLSWLTAVTSAASGQLARFSARDSAMLLWALAALGFPPERQLLPQLLGGLSMSSCKLKSATPQDIAHISWAVATFQHMAAADMHGAAGTVNSSSSSRTRSRSTRANGSRAGALQQQQEGVNVGASWLPHQQEQQQTKQRHRAGVLPDEQLQGWFRLAWQLTQPAAAAAESSIPNTTSSSKRQQPPAVMYQANTFEQHPATKLNPVDAAQLLWSASQLDRSCWPTRSWMAHFWSQTAAPNLAHASAQSLTVTLWASLRMGHRPPGAVLMAAVPALQRQLAELQPAAACQLLCVLAKLQHRPNPAFMEQLLSRLQLDSHQLQPHAFACVLWAIGRLGFSPGATWWSTVLQHLEVLVGQLGERELANVVFGLVTLGVCGRQCSTSNSNSNGSEQGGVALPTQLKAALLQRAEQLSICDADAGADDAAGAAAVSMEQSMCTRQQPLQQLIVFLQQ